MRRPDRAGGSRDGASQETIMRRPDRAGGSRDGASQETTMRGPGWLTGKLPAAHGIRLDDGQYRTDGLGHRGQPAPGRGNVSRRSRNRGTYGLSRRPGLGAGNATTVAARRNPGPRIAGVDTDPVRGGATARQPARPAHTRAQLPRPFPAAAHPVRPGSLKIPGSASSTPSTAPGRSCYRHPRRCLNAPPAADGKLAPPGPGRGARRRALPEPASSSSSSLPASSSSSLSSSSPPPPPSSGFCC